MYENNMIFLGIYAQTILCFGKKEELDLVDIILREMMVMIL